VAALAVSYACLLPDRSPGAGAVGGVWLVVALWVGAVTIFSGGPLLTWELRHAVTAVAAGYTVVAASWFELSRLGVSPLGIDEPIVQLTAVHFTFVGVAALLLALAAYERAPSRRGRRLGVVALSLTAGAPVIIALGFVTHGSWAQIGGAALMSIGVFCTAGLELAAVARPGTTDVRVLLGVSGLSVWFPMVLAVLWAAAQHIGVWAPGIDAMVRTHGALNAIGFVAAGLIALALERRNEAVDPEALPCR
jgi:hypothetical protein